VLHDAESERALAIVFFETEDDYRRGEEVLNAMPAGETPGQRTSVTRYDVATFSGWMAVGPPPGASRPRARGSKAVSGGA
jgi:hypothetical protein